jgi:hypothetical protein
VLSPDHHDVLSEFIDGQVEFLLVGAYALAAHGLVRATGDLDLWVRPTAANAARVVAALQRFGAPAEHFSAADFVRPDSVVQVGVEPFRIDVLTSIDGVGFEQAWAHRISASIEGLSGPVIGREELIANKRATGRPQDALDAQRLEHLRP